MNRSTVLCLLTALMLSLITACQRSEYKSLVKTTKGAKLLTVDFQQSQTFRYKFLSNRDTEVVMEDPSKRAQGKTTKYSEMMEMVVAYTVVDVDPYSFSTIKARCESINVTRNPAAGVKSDAAKNFAGKSFTIRVGPTGKIESRKELEALIKEVAESAFRKSTEYGRIKEPDMVCDFLATQWFLWDAVSSVDNPAKGIAVGDSWESRLSIPTPMVMHKARDVVYKLEEVHQSDTGEVAVITSSYSLSKKASSDWPVPYSGSFKLSGPFGLYGRYRDLGLQGTGKEHFNIDAGRIERAEQDYEMSMAASLPLPIVSIKINIKQKLTMQLLEN